ncbi:unnamed protein product, partial [Ectocarpus sp. 12 AP-2014]
DNFDEFSAETLAAIDNELQQIKLALLQRFPQLDLSSVFPIGQVRKKTYPTASTATTVPSHPHTVEVGGCTDNNKGSMLKLTTTTHPQAQVFDAKL